MIEIEILNYPSSIDRWDLVVAFLRLRRTVFIDRLDWELSAYEGMEFEQYDGFHSTYVIAVDGGKVVGGARLLRCDREASGSGRVRYSYMIKDAFDGKLQGLPSQLCGESPTVCGDYWELTRLVSVGGVDVAKGVLLRAVDYLRSEAALGCLCLGPPAFIRMAKSLGFSSLPLGDVVRNESGAFLAFSVDLSSGGGG